MTRTEGRVIIGVIPVRSSATGSDLEVSVRTVRFTSPLILLYQRQTKADMIFGNKLSLSGLVSDLIKYRTSLFKQHPTVKFGCFRAKETQSRFTFIVGFHVQRQRGQVLTNIAAGTSCLIRKSNTKWNSLELSKFRIEQAYWQMRDGSVISKGLRIIKEFKLSIFALSGRYLQLVSGIRWPELQISATHAGPLYFHPQKVPKCTIRSNEAFFCCQQAKEGFPIVSLFEVQKWPTTSQGWHWSYSLKSGFGFFAQNLGEFDEIFMARSCCNWTWR